MDWLKRVIFRKTPEAAAPDYTNPVASLEDVEVQIQAAKTPHERAKIWSNFVHHQPDVEHPEAALTIEIPDSDSGSDFDSNYAKTRPIASTQPNPVGLEQATSKTDAFMLEADANSLLNNTPKLKLVLSSPLTMGGEEESDEDIKCVEEVDSDEDVVCVEEVNVREEIERIEASCQISAQETPVASKLKMSPGDGDDDGECSGLSDASSDSEGTGEIVSYTSEDSDSSSILDSDDCCSSEESESDSEEATVPGVLTLGNPTTSPQPANAGACSNLSPEDHCPAVGATQKVYWAGTTVSPRNAETVSGIISSAVETARDQNVVHPPMFAPPAPQETGMTRPVAIAYFPPRPALSTSILNSHWRPISSLRPVSSSSAASSNGSGGSQYSSRPSSSSNSRPSSRSGSRSSSVGSSWSAAPMQLPAETSPKGKHYHFSYVNGKLMKKLAEEGRSKRAQSYDEAPSKRSCPSSRSEHR